MRQNIFTIVPNPLGMQGLIQRQAGETPSRRPMTSKQAQKLYKQATRQPRISKAEQRRRDKEEQERIRKELEKEKQAAKARSAREKKKAKEQQALEDKKRKGLPIVVVHPSQDTISRFVRGNGVGKKRDSAGNQFNLRPVAEEEEDAESATEGLSDEEGSVATIQPDSEIPTAAAERQDSQSRESKRLRVDAQENPSKEEDRGKEGEQPGERLAPVLVRKLSEQRSRESSINVDDPTIETMVQTQLISEASAAASSSVRRPQSPNQPPVVPPARISHNNELKEAPKQSPAILVRVPSDKSPNGAVRNSPQLRTPFREVPIDFFIIPGLEEKARSAQRYASPFRPAPKPLPSARHRAVAPVPSMPRFKPQILTPDRRTERPKFLPKHLCTPASRPQSSEASKVPGQESQSLQASSVPPSSTQLFVLSHLDDFPSPSQEVRELQELELPSVPVSKPAVPHPPSIFRKKLVSKPVPDPGVSTPASDARPYQQEQTTALPFFSTQDFVLSSQDQRELEQGAETPSKAGKEDSNGTEPQVVNTAGHGGSNAFGRSFSRAHARGATPAEIPKQPHPAQLREAGRGSRHRSTTTNGTRPDLRRHSLANQSGSQKSQDRAPGRSSSRISARQSQNSQRSTDGAVRVDARTQARSQNLPAIAVGSAALPPSPHPAPARDAESAGPCAERLEPRSSTAHPEKGRFFTSSNREAFFLAKERSVQTYREEERRRETERREKEWMERKRREEECKEDDLEILMQHADEFDKDEESLEPARDGVQESLEEDRSQSHGGISSGGGHGKTEPEAQVPTQVNASQETDYGDLGWAEGAMDVLENLMEQGDFWDDDFA